MVITASTIGLPLVSAAQQIQWSVAAELPAGVEGVAGPFSGVSGDVLLVAGGANFPNGKPWEGGRKAYTDAVYIVRRESGGAFSCRLVDDFRLPVPSAYGCSVTTPAGVVCIGGETPSGYSDAVFVLCYDPRERRLSTHSLPALPHAMANACAVAIGSRLYVFGGEDAHKALAAGYCLDLSSPGAGWQSLPPMPLAVSHSVAVAMGASGVYIIGGRSKTDSGISDLHPTLFRFDVSTRVWSRGKDMGTNLSAASAIAVGDRILVIGGDRGDIFHRIEVCNARIAAAKSDSISAGYARKKLNLVLNHPGFSDVVLEYDPHTDRWKKIGTLPGEVPVTTTAVRWGSEVFVPCGELRPGVRSRVIWKGIFSGK